MMRTSHDNRDSLKFSYFSNERIIYQIRTPETYSPVSCTNNKVILVMILYLKIIILNMKSMNTKVDYNDTVAPVYIICKIIISFYTS